jgi:hypothetical protein
MWTGLGKKNCGGHSACRDDPNSHRQSLAEPALSGKIYDFAVIELIFHVHITPLLILFPLQIAD